MSDFTTLREGSLHAALKARYAATVTAARVEAAVGSSPMGRVPPNADAGA